jgi:hypothetical protein
MSQTDTRATKDLFREWRQGDAQAGQIMAQRFADWYYAIATSRLGEAAGQGPCERACQKFGQGVASVTESRALVSWAHDIIKAELQTAGATGRAGDLDEPNAYTVNQRPKTLLVAARKALPAELRLLEACYRGKMDDPEVEKLAEPLGGIPLGVLKARYKVKQYIRDQFGAPFEVAPDQPVLDRAPLPLYESGQMANPEEEVNFEQWMLSDINLCKDIAEFAHFAIALRGGLPSDEQAAAQAAKAQTAANLATEEAAAGGGGGGGAAVAAGGAAIVVIGGLVVAGLIAAVVIGYLMMG